MDNEIRVLDRLSITGILSYQTPLCVIAEIAGTYSIRYDEQHLDNEQYLMQVITKIYNKKPKRVKSPYAKEDLRLIAQFVNEKHNWKLKPLMTAYNFLYKFTELTPDLTLNFEYGAQTPTKPEILNACVLYKYCKHYDIKTSRNMTLVDMANSIKIYLSMSDPEIQNIARRELYELLLYDDLNRSAVLNMLSSVTKSQILARIPQGNIMLEPEENRAENTYVLKHDELNIAGLTISNRDIKLIPETHVEAVAMAALYYKIDISHVKNPLLEYKELMHSPYIPIDRKLARNMKYASLHPDSVTNPRLDKIFRPEIPESLYTEEDLINLCYNEGYSNSDVVADPPYTILQTAYFLSNFHHGYQIENVRISNEENTFMDEFKDLDYDSVVIYGSIIDVDYDVPFKAFTYGELKDVFQHMNRFYIPGGDGDNFSENAINKLHMLCSVDQRANESKQDYEDRIGLGGEIERVRYYQKTNNEIIRRFVDIYNDARLEERVLVEEVLTSLMECAMYMRGWNGTGDYPIRSQDTNFPSEEQINVNIRVTVAINELEDKLDRINLMDNLGELIRDLPLMMHDDLLNFYPSIDEDEGLTIRDRLHIVRGGVDGSMQSCIRMSSNRFCSTAYFYMKLICMNVSFDMRDVSVIQ